MITRTIRFAIASFLLIAFSLNLSNAADTSKKTSVDPSNSKLEWIGEKILGQHNGFVAIQSGELQFNKGVLSGGFFVIDMNSITCVDIENPEYNAKLVGHLKNDDFFSVEKHPTATLKITKVVKGKNGNATVTALLSIKGKTNPITFPVKVSFDGKKYTATASFSIDRTKWDIQYGSASIFQSIGDKAIKDEVKFKVLLQTK